MTTREIIDLEQKYILQTYGRPEFVLEKGDGVHIVDTDGKHYLDFVSGLSVNALGYNNSMIQEAANAQLGKLIHVSNLYHTIPAPQLAQLLCEHSFADRVFFCNSGTESIEAALKFARKWGYKNFEDAPKNKIIALNNSFHGRTYGGISATGQPKYHQGFGPMLPGIEFADLNDLESVEKIADGQTVAVLLEPLQAEGGIHSSDPAFLEGVRALCDEMKMLLIFDEIQCGLGRAGSLFCYEQYGVTPDIMTLAKPLAGGLPIGATLVTQDVADAVEPGDHAATFGAHPVSCAVAVEVFKTISDPEFIAGIQEKSAYLFGKLNALKDKHADKVTEIRGSGLIAGAVLKEEIPAADAMNAIREDNDILVCVAGPDVVRFLPPLVIEKEHIDEAVNALDEFLTD